jgi:hypothetical protein
MPMALWVGAFDHKAQRFNGDFGPRVKDYGALKGLLG